MLICCMTRRAFGVVRRVKGVSVSPVSTVAAEAQDAPGALLADPQGQLKKWRGEDRLSAPRHVDRPCGLKAPEAVGGSFQCRDCDRRRCFHCGHLACALEARSGACSLMQGTCVLRQSPGTRHLSAGADAQPHFEENLTIVAVECRTHSSAPRRQVGCERNSETYDSITMPVELIDESGENRLIDELPLVAPCRVHTLYPWWRRNRRRTMTAVCRIVITYSTGHATQRMLDCTSVGSENQVTPSATRITATVSTGSR